MADDLRTFYKLHLQLGFSAHLSLSPDVVMPLKDMSVSTYSSVFPNNSVRTSALSLATQSFKAFLGGGVFLSTSWLLGPKDTGEKKVCGEGKPLPFVELGA